MFARLRAKRPGTASVAQLLFYEAGRAFVWVIWKTFWRFRQVHPERLPAEGPVLIVANHQSYLDPVSLTLGATQRHVDFLARAGLFKNPFFRWLITALNAVPLAEGRPDAAALKTVIERLRLGHAVLIFPEGARTPDGAVHEFKRGFAVLAKRAECPVMPAAIEGAFDTWPKERKGPRLFGCRVAVMYGEPISPEELLADGADAALVRLRGEIDAMRLELREGLRARTRGRFPRGGAGDGVRGAHA
jgi:1-acyl-sn-glycerol-3-phosphate acyltransferase